MSPEQTMSINQTCTHCGKDLHPDRVAYLELHCETHEWAKPGKAEWSDSPDSQGIFPFGQACSRKVYKTQQCNFKGL